MFGFVVGISDYDGTFENVMYLYNAPKSMLKFGKQYK